MENSIKNQLEESRKDGTLKETLQGMGFNRLQSVEIAKGLNNEVYPAGTRRRHGYHTVCR